MEPSNKLVAMLRLLGLLTCVSLAFIFPIFAYEYNNTAMIYNVVSTITGSTVIIKFVK